MIRVLVVTPYGKDANSYHRCVGPWSYLAKVARAKGEQIEFSVVGDDIGMSGVGWDVVGQFDIVSLHRPCRPDDLTIMRIARNMNVPTVIDYDDWLFEVPYWNPHANSYADPSLQNIMATCIATADVVTVTTSALYDKFKPINKNTLIIPNAYRSDLYPYREKVTPPRKSEYCWRGTNTHDADLLSVGQGFQKLSKPVTFYGGAAWSLLAQMKPGMHQVRGNTDPFMYMRQIYEDSPRVMLFPLVDCLFNRVKSNIAYQEAVHAGALCVAPDLPEWTRPGILNYTPGDPNSFLAAAETAVGLSDKTHADQVQLGYDKMIELYDASVINEIRFKMVQAIMDPGFERNQRSPFDNLVGVWAMSVLRGKPKDLAEINPQSLKKALGG